MMEDQEAVTKNVLVTSKHIREIQKEIKCMDVDLSKLYFSVLKQLLGRNFYQKCKDLRRFFFKFRTQSNAWCQFNDNPLQMVLESRSYRLACIFRNSTILSSAVIRFFQSALLENRDFLQSLLCRTKIKICALGGGSASEVVAIVKVLQLIGNFVGSKPDFHVTVIEENENWKSTCIAVLENLEYFCNTTGKIDFIHADLFKEFSADVEKALGDADIITMVKFLSNIEYKEGDQTLYKIFQAVCCCAGPESMIFILDFPDARIACASVGISSWRAVFQVTYVLHTLHMDAVKNHFLQYNEYFGGYMCNTHMKVFARMWLKSGVKMSIDPTYFHTATCLIEVQEKITEKEEYLSIRRAEYAAAEKSEKDSFESWKAVYTEKMKKSGWTQKKINQVVLSKRKEHKKKLTGCKIMVEIAVKELEAEQNLALDLQRQYYRENLKQWWKKVKKKKKECMEEYETYQKSVSNYLLYLKQNLPCKDKINESSEVTEEMNMMTIS